jgi:hypothetical protein
MAIAILCATVNNAGAFVPVSEVRKTAAERQLE